MPAATLCHLADIPLRLAHLHEGCGPLLTDWAREDAAEGRVRHEVCRQLDLVAAVGAQTDDEHLSFHVRPQASWRARMKLDEAGIDVKRAFIAVSPGNAAPWPGWEPGRFAAAAAKLAMALDCQVVVMGDAGERGLAETVRRGAGDHARSLAGCLSLEESAAVMELAPLLLANSGAAVHIAAAVGTPVVAIHTRDDSRRLPWKIANRVLADAPFPGSPGRIGGVTVDDVVATACDLWLDIHWRTAA